MTDSGRFPSTRSRRIRFEQRSASTVSPDPPFLFFFRTGRVKTRQGVPGEMSDKTLSCRDCGQEFTFTAGEQAFYLERGFSEPQRCPACRAGRKSQRSSSGGYDSGGGGYSSGSYGGGGGGGSYSGGGGGGFSGAPRQMYPATCSNCGKQTEVPFMPRSDKPVFCRECFSERRSSAPRNYGDF